VGVDVGVGVGAEVGMGVGVGVDVGVGVGVSMSVGVHAQDIPNWNILFGYLTQMWHMMVLVSEPSAVHHT
jgi:hypothetical protein